MLAAGGWPGGILVMVSLVLDFYYRPIPGLDRYMTEKYGEQWTRYKNEVPKLMFPGIF